VLVRRWPALNAGATEVWRDLRRQRHGLEPRSDDPRIGGNHARAYAEVGVRDVVSVGPCAPPWPHPASVWENGRREDRLVSFDLFQAMRRAKLFHWMMSRDLFLFPPGNLLEMVTVDAATALEWDDEVGSLEPCKKADVIVVNLRQPHLVPDVMVVHRLVYEAVGNDVETVIVDGRVLMEDRTILTVDEAGVLDRAQEESQKLIERAGLQRHLSEPGWGKLRLEFDAPVELPCTPTP
jgi:hypothetical protein